MPESKEFTTVDAYERDGEKYGTRMDVNSGVVCVESLDRTNFSQAITRLQSPDAKRYAQHVAAERGVSDPRLDFVQSPYPVDATGGDITNPLVQKIAAYRVDFKITGRLV